VSGRFFLGGAMSYTAIEVPTRDGEIIRLSRDLGLKGRLLQIGWELPANLSFEDWKEAGGLLGKIERSVAWWLGDWWAFGEARYGERKAIVSSDEWEGPDFQTCMAAASVCRAFETCRRRQVLGFSHHREVASLPPAEQDALLEWCEEGIAETGRPRSTRELRSEASRRRVTLGAQPSSSTCTVSDLSELVASGIRFGCIYADPPWLYDNQGTRAATGNHYSGMTADELCALPVRALAASDAHLHLWTTNGFLFDAPRIFAAWGFEFRSSLIWIKPQLGIGNYWRNSHEFLLTAIRGNAKRFNDKSLKSWLECDRGAHSAKPEQVRAMLERASPGPFMEMFGRRVTDGWTVWGNQIERSLFWPGQAA
jgi:N6-adenosine-specific RNA methylase IME4